MAADRDVSLSGGTDHMELLKDWRLDDRVKSFLCNSRIYKYISELDAVRVDTKLVSFLCNSYEDGHFHIGNHRLYLGLQDIFYLTGLPIDGKPVISNSQDIDGLCERLLGRIPPKKNVVKSGYVGLKWLKEEFEEVNVPADSPDIHRYVRAYLLFVLGCVVFPGLPRHQVPGDYLHLFDDLSAIDDFAWGSAMLAHLHVALKRVRDKNSKGKNLSASCFILQIFALEHLPKLVTSYFGGDFELPKAIPLAGGWSKLLARYSRNNNKKFNMAEADEISLTPYNRVLISDPNFLDQFKLCGGRFYSICLDRIWFYSYEDCADQLGLPPVDNPLPKMDVGTLPKCRKGEQRDWEKYYEGYVAHWNDRQSTCVDLSLPAIVEDEMEFMPSPGIFTGVSPSSALVADGADQPLQEHTTEMPSPVIEEGPSLPSSHILPGGDSVLAVDQPPQKYQTKRRLRKWCRKKYYTFMVKPKRSRHPVLNLFL
ncbi:protein MAINTENANCE OF MERISTEMS-like [Pistacia vera]|uniref:protein MAINTENANCE OF MERISTEMS-like n=1 Tax=Pistacia vera TaxID=55513 RepID=UPI0012639034|nr:protein MAINTENANCE OF MERISTEMS-like [Pistacia vera]